MPTLFTVAGFPFVTMLIERYPSTGPGDRYQNCRRDCLPYFGIEADSLRGVYVHVFDDDQS